MGNLNILVHQKFSIVNKIVFKILLIYVSLFYWFSWTFTNKTIMNKNIPILLEIKSFNRVNWYSIVIMLLQYNKKLNYFKGNHRVGCNDYMNVFCIRMWSFFEYMHMMINITVRLCLQQVECIWQISYDDL
jgi:hypothetical protein